MTPELPDDQLTRALRAELAAASVPHDPARADAMIAAATGAKPLGARSWPAPLAAAAAVVVVGGGAALITAHATSGGSDAAGGGPVAGCGPSVSSTPAAPPSSAAPSSAAPSSAAPTVRSTAAPASSSAPEAPSSSAVEAPSSSDAEAPSSTPAARTTTAGSQPTYVPPRRTHVTPAYSGTASSSPASIAGPSTPIPTSPSETVTLTVPAGGPARTATAPPCDPSSTPRRAPEPSTASSATPRPVLTLEPDRPSASPLRSRTVTLHATPGHPDRRVVAVRDPQHLRLVSVRLTKVTGPGILRIGTPTVRGSGRGSFRGVSVRVVPNRGPIDLPFAPAIRLTRANWVPVELSCTGARACGVSMQLLGGT